MYVLCRLEQAKAYHSRRLSLKNGCQREGNIILIVHDMLKARWNVEMMSQGREVGDGVEDSKALNGA
jgi:hypothetical protein